MNTRHNRLVAAIAGIIAGNMTSGTVSAQQPAAASGRIDEVLVTARRREENLQDVPISITSISAADIELRGIEVGRDLSALVPNFQVGRISATSQSDDLIIRGIPGVGIYVDGVWQGSRGFMVGSIVEMDRVEILRGPQGTLFGRDTNGGAVQYVTKLPASEFGARVSTSLGNYSRRYLSGSMDMPLSDNLLTKLTAAGRKKDGWMHSLVVDKSYGHENDAAVRGDVLWKPLSNLDVRFVASSEKIETTYERQVRFLEAWPQENRPAWNECCWTTLYNIAMRNPDFGPYDFWQGPFPNVRFAMSEYTPYSNESGYPGGLVGEWETNSVQPGDSQTFNINQYTAILDWHITPKYSLKSITAYREQDGQNYIDLDASPLVLTEDLRYDRNLWLQQEFHFTGSLLDDRLDFLLGAFWAKSKDYQRLYRWRFAEFFVQDANGNPTPNIELRNFIRAWGVANNNNEFRNWSPGNPFQGSTFNKSEAKDRAIFGELTYNITNAWSSTLGVRWSWKDTKSSVYAATEAQRTWLAPGQGGGRNPGDVWAGRVTSVEEPDLRGGIFTPKFSTSYRFNDALMIYASYAEGYTSAERTFVDVLNDFIDLDPEVVKSYELGMRSDWLDNRLRFNVTYFQNRWDGIRVPIHMAPPNDPNAFTNVTTSAGKAEARGVDVDILYAPIDPLRFDVSVGLLDTEYLEVGLPELSGLRRGAPFALAPKFSTSAGVQYSLRPASGSEISFRTDYGYKSEYQRGASVQRQIPRPEPGYGLLSARIKYTTPSENWSATLFGSNLTNVRYVDSGIASPPIGLDLTQIGPPRQYGVTFNFTFR